MPRRRASSATWRMKSTSVDAQNIGKSRQKWMTGWITTTMSVINGSWRSCLPTNIMNIYRQGYTHWKELLMKEKDNLRAQLQIKKCPWQGGQFIQFEIEAQGSKQFYDPTLLHRTASSSQSMTINALDEKSYRFISWGAVSMRACAVALTTCKERSSQRESMRRSFSISEFLAGFSG